MEKFAPYLPYLPIVPYVIVIQGGQYELDYVGPSVERITGYHADTFMWSFWKERIHQDDRPQLYEAMEHNRQQGNPEYEYEYRWRFADEQYKWLLDSGRVLFDEQGRPNRFVGTWLDITRHKEPELERAQADVLFRTALKNTLVAFSAQDTELRFTQLYNSQLLTDEESIYGRRLDEIMDPTTAKKLEHTKVMALQTGRTYDEEREFIDLKVEKRVYWYHVAPIFDENEKVIGVTNVRVDVTDRARIEQELRETKQRFEVALKESPITIVIQDPELHFLWVYNSQLSNDTDPLGLTDRELFGPELGNKLAAIKQQAMMKRQTIIREIDTSFNGRAQSFQMRFEPLINEAGEVEGIASVSMNITQLKFTQRQLEKRTKDLERSNKDLEQFAYAASHDLQEPLRAVTGYLDLLRKLYGHQLDDQAQEFIQEAVAGAERMRALIQGLLTYSRINRKNNSFQLVAIETILQAVRQNLRPLILEHNATITCDSLPTVHVDPIQITQLLQNLISNAIKFRSERPPHIHISAHQTENVWEFRVKDNGIGIEPQYKERIFTIFQRLHTRDEIEGLGIGLALCRRIVERHNGRIWVESPLGEGTTFIFTIPIS